MLTVINLILIILELIAVAIFAICVFRDRDKPWNLYVRFFTSLALTIINLVQIPINIVLEQSYVLSIILVILWGMDLFPYYSEIKKLRAKKK